MNKGINITVSGNANAAFGTVVQGNARDVHGTAAVAVDLKQLEQAAEAAGIPPDSPQLAEIRTKLEVLVAEAAKKSEADTGRGSAILKTIRENHSWAFPAIKDIVKGVWPALLAAALP